MEHKELLYFPSLQIKLYQHLIQKRDAQAPLTLREKELIELYEDAMNHQSKTGTRVKRQNKFPKRKKPPSTMSVMADGTRFVKDNLPLFPLIRGFSVYRT